MIGDLLELGMNFDWAMPIVAWIRDRANEGGHTFVMPDKHMMVAMLEVCQELNNYEITHWGVMLVSGHWMITVPPDNAGLAQQIIQSLGCWIEYGWIEGGE